MKGFKTFIAGVLAGAVIMTAVPVFAENEMVTVVVDRTISMIIAGQSKTLPEDYEILNYKGYTYLPSRYVAEQLGATVAWDENTRTIIINEPPAKEVEKIVEVPVEVEKIVYVERDEGYSSLPASGSKDNISVLVTGVENLNFTFPASRVYAEVRNTSGYLVTMDYFSAVLTVDGKSYKTVEQPDQNYETGFITAEFESKTISDHFSLPQIETGTHDCILTVPFTNQETGDKTVVQVKFTATIKD